MIDIGCAMQAEAYARVKGFTHIECSGAQENGSAGLEHVIEVLLSLIVDWLPSPVEPVALLKRGVKVGHALLSEPAYRSSLFEHLNLKC